MLDWSNLQHFLAFATTDSLPKAAELLGVDRTTVSRRIAGLEQAFGATLFERKGRNLVLTSSGREVLAVVESIDGALHGLGRRVYGRDKRIEGTIRLTLTSGIAKVIASEVALFMTQHPQIFVEMNVTNSAEDLEQMEADIAIRITDSPPDNLVGRKLVDLNSALYASARKRLDPHAELAYFALMGERTLSGWVRECLPNARVVATANHVDVLCELVAAGGGVGEFPCYVGEGDARLVRISDVHPYRYPHAWLLYHPQLRGVQRLRAFAEHLAQSFRTLAPVFEGGAGPTLQPVPAAVPDAATA
jgi:DNA-binding transcriptional LysR family regulator